MTDANAPNQLPLTPPKPRKPRQPRQPKAPAYTGKYAGGLLTTYPDTKLTQSYASSALRQRIGLAWAVLRGREVTYVGPLTFITPKNAVPSFRKIEEVLNGAPDNHPAVRTLLD